MGFCVVFYVQICVIQVFIPVIPASILLYISAGLFYDTCYIVWHLFDGWSKVRTDPFCSPQGQTYYYYSTCSHWNYHNIARVMKLVSMFPAVFI